jgi:cobalt-zinc-cadmium efflux system outer membrane protein
MRTFTITVAICLTAVFSSCAAQKYHPAPISPAASAASLRSRTLKEEGLHRYFEKQGNLPSGQWPPKEWNLPELTLAAFYYSPTLEIARTRVEEADAAVITAGARPNPVLSGSAGGSTSAVSPWVGSLGFPIPIETAGKRRDRINAAQSLADAARWELANTAWTVRSQVRSALLQYTPARRRLLVLGEEERLRAEQVKLLEQRLAAGMISRPEVDLARIQYTQTAIAREQAQEQLAASKPALAAAVGVPVAALNQVEVEWTSFEHPPSAAALPQSAIQEDAVLNRLDIRRALADYAATQASLQLEIARQYPDFNLGPAYNYEDGNHDFALGFSLVLPILNQNQGPIAQAQARRKQAAAQFLATQAAGIAASEQALARYRAALNELDQARKLQRQSAAREEAIRRAFAAGQIGRVALNGAQLQVAVAAGAELDALYRAQLAMGELEDSVQRPIELGDLPPLTPQSPLLQPNVRKK